MIKCFCDRYVCVESQQLDDDDLIGNRPRFRRGSFRALRESRAAGMSRRDFANGAQFAYSREETTISLFVH